MTLGFDPMRPAELSCRVARCLLIYLRKRYRRPVVKELCTHAGLPLEYLQDENNWISYAAYLRLLDELVELTGSERAVYDQGLEAASIEAYGGLYFIWRSLLTPQLVYQAVAYLFPRFTRTGVFKALEVQGSRAEMQFVNHPQCPQSRLNCLSIQGQLASVPLAWGLPAAHLEHPECQLKGDSRCLYRLRWVARPSFGWISFVLSPLLLWAGSHSPASMPLGIAAAGMAILVGTWLDMWKILRDNRQINDVASEMMAHSMEAVEGRNADLRTALEEVRHRNRILVNVPTALAVLDERLSVQYVNPAFRSLFGLPSDPDVEEAFCLVLPEGLRLDYQDVMAGSPPRSRETIMAGRIVHAYVFELPTAADGGKRIGMALTDMAERETLVRQLVQSEKLASIGLLTSGMAHQLNNPLFGIMGLAEALLEEDDMESVRRHAAKVLRYSEVAADIIRELNRYARTAQPLEAGDPVDVNQALEEAIDLVHFAGLIDGVNIRREMAPEVYAWGSFQEIQQVFVNLLHNAGDALGGHGEIVIRTACHNGYVEACVSDSGPGIAPEHLERLFDPFFTTKPAGRGTGLGLSVVQRIVTRYNGTVGVDSELGQGTTFRVRLPADRN